MSIPFAPTLDSPANMANADASSGQLLGWTFNDATVGDVQGSYALRRKIAGVGAYSYWDGAAWVTDATASYLGAGFLYLGGIAQRYARTPNAANGKPAGDVEVVVRVALDDWTPAAQTILLSNLVAATTGFEVGITSAGAMYLQAVKSGPATVTPTSTANLATVDGTTIWLKFTRASASGNTNFYWAADSDREPTVWTQLGAANVASTAGAILNATAELRLGNRPDGSFPAKGKFYRAIVRHAIGGAAQADFDMARMLTNAQAFVATTGEIWSAIICPYVTTATTSVTIAFASWPNSDIYQWSIATRDGNGYASPFANDRLLVSTALPVVTVTAPTGTQASSRPTVNWTYAQANGIGQGTWRIRVFTAAQYGIGGFDPATSPATWDSGEIEGPYDWTKVIGTDLANSTTYRAYMQVSSTGAEYSAWAYSQFTMSLALPTPPTVVVTSEPDYGRAKIVLRADFNLLTDEQADLEGGTTVGWAGLQNANIINSTAQASGGTHSMLITASGQTYSQLDTNYGLYSDEDTAFADFAAQTASMA